MNGHAIYDWVSFEYPNKCFIVEVSYAAADVAISEIRCKDFPKEKDNSRGFSVNFRTYEAAEKHARHIAQELGYSF